MEPLLTELRYVINQLEIKAVTSSVTYNVDHKKGESDIYIDIHKPLLFSVSFTLKELAEFDDYAKEASKDIDHVIKKDNRYTSDLKYKLIPDKTASFFPLDNRINVSTNVTLQAKDSNTAELIAMILRDKL